MNSTTSEDRWVSAAASSGGLRDFSPLAVGVLLQLLVVAVIVSLVRTGAWDDGAITLAFSKTFAESGRIALTPLSEQVEGYSSVSWFLINAALALFHPGFDGAIMLSQLLAAIFVTVCLYFLFKICRAVDLSTPATYLILAFVAIGGPSVAETSNGMEMTLFCASGLAITYFTYFKPALKLALIAIAIFLSTRFEAPFYLIFLIAPLLWRRRFGDAAAWAIVAAAVLAVLAAYRYRAFADVLPNTIYAKMNPPYSEFGLGALRRRLIGAFEIPLIIAPFLLITAWAVVRKGRSGIGPALDGLRKWKQVDMFVLPVVGAELFGILVGKNWGGYVGRMAFFALPYALILVGIVYDRYRLEFRALARPLGLVVAFSTIPFSWLIDNSQHMWAILHGLQPAKHEVPSLSPQFFSETCLAVDRLRSVLDMDSLVYMTPDVGGVGLRCPKLRVVDIGLLTNRTLAHGGYKQLPAVLASERPDVIDARWRFASLPDIYHIGQFSSDYRPVLIDATRLFLRSDHAQALLEQGRGSLCSMQDSRCYENIESRHRYFQTLDTSDVDDAEYVRFGSYVDVPAAR
jgi:hypothetical protein